MENRVGGKMWLIKLIRTFAAYEGDKLSYLKPAKALAESLMEHMVSREDYELLKQESGEEIATLANRVTCLTDKCARLEDEYNRHVALIGQMELESFKYRRIITDLRSDLLAAGKALVSKIVGGSSLYPAASRWTYPHDYVMQLERIAGKHKDSVVRAQLVTALHGLSVVASGYDADEKMDREAIMTGAKKLLQDIGYPRQASQHEEE